MGLDGGYLDYSQSGSIESLQRRFGAAGQTIFRVATSDDLPAVENAGGDKVAPSWCATGVCNDAAPCFDATPNTGGCDAATGAMHFQGGFAQCRGEGEQCAPCFVNSPCHRPELGDTGPPATPAPDYGTCIGRNCPAAATYAWPEGWGPDPVHDLEHVRTNPTIAAHVACVCDSPCVEFNEFKLWPANAGNSACDMVAEPEVPDDPSKPDVPSELDVPDASTAAMPVAAAAVVYTALLAAAVAW